MVNVLKFFSKSKEGKELSNFYKGNVIIDDRLYNCGESAFHGSKYIVVSDMKNLPIKRKCLLLEYGRKFEVGGDFGDLDGSQLKSKGGKKGLMLTMEELKYWDIKSDVIQIKICQYKYDTNHRIREIINDSKGRYLVHSALRLSLENVKKRKWEGRIVIEDGKPVLYGGNKLGCIWMKIRDIYD